MILLVEHKYEEKNKQVYNSQKHVIYKWIVWLEYNRGQYEQLLHWDECEMVLSASLLNST